MSDIPPCQVRHYFDPKEAYDRGKWPEIDKLVFEMIKEKRRQNICVDQDWIKKKALAISQDVDLTFKASNGWLNNFLKRFNLVSRAVTSVGQKVILTYRRDFCRSFFELIDISFVNASNKMYYQVPPNAPALIRNYFEHVDEHLKGLPLSDILNMDETPMYFDMPRNRTFDLRAVQTVPAKTAGYDKLRFTVVLTIAADGTKLFPMIIFKGKYSIHEFDSLIHLIPFSGLKNIPKGNYPTDVIVTVSMKGSMKEELMLEYIAKVVKGRRQSLWKMPSALIMDSYRSHLMDSIKKEMNRLNCKRVIIPGGMTPILQQLDVYINKSMKCEMKKEYNQWLDEGIREFTASGNRKRASYEEVANWVSRAWKRIDKDMVSKLFRNLAYIHSLGICHRDIKPQNLLLDPNSCLFQVKQSFVGCGVVLPRKFEELHSRLKDLIEHQEVDLDEEHTGVTDDEDEGDEEEVVED